MMNKPALFGKNSILSQSRGFNLIELLTAVAIVGTLAVVGIKSYQAQTNKARSAEAKHSLSYLYTAETGFKESWGAYHENLIAIGAGPSGQYYYDVGFGNIANTAMSKTEGNLGSYPLPASLDVPACTNFQRICAGTCLTSLKDAIPADYRNYFSGSLNCKVNGGLYSSNVDLTAISNLAQTDLKAGEGSFKAIASAKLKSQDVWTINHERIIEHKADGTQ